MTKTVRIAKKVTQAKKKAAGRLPDGWDEARMQGLVTHYETQSEDQAVAEDEAAWAHARTSMIEVPDRLVPAVRALLAKAN